MPKTLNAPKKRENENDKESETYASRRDIAPLSAVRPPRQSTYECQDQKDDQNSSKHFFPCKVNSAVEIHAPGPSAAV